MDKRSLIFLIALSIAFLFLNNYLFPPREVPPQVAPEQAAVQKPKASLKPGEELYVIENDYQQLVFSSLGGSLSEINLVLKSKENPKSVVRPIEADRVLTEDYAKESRFPLGAYQTYEGKKAEGKLGGYYPLLRRGSPAAYYGLAVAGEAEDAVATTYRLKRLEKNLIELEGETDNRRVTKTFSLPENSELAPYCFDVTISIEGDGRSLWLTTGVPEVELISGSSAPTLKYRYTRGQKPVVEQVDLPKATTVLSSVQPDWICNSNGFLGIILDPLSEAGQGFGASLVPGDKAPTRLSVIDAQHDLYPASKYPGYDMRIPFKPSAQKTSFRVFAGPFAKDVLKLVDSTYSDPKTGYNPDFVSCISFHGWFSFISEPFAKFLFFLMDIFHMISRSWGISIILLTMALRVMLYPLNAWSIKSTAKLQQISPKVAALQEKYKKDPKKAQLEIMNLYRQQGVNPLGGCLPLLIQMPFLIGMFDLLKSSFELRGAPFIPGWIDNLTAPDIVFSWGYPIWFIGTSLHALPILLGGVMYWQQKMSASLPKDKSQWTDQQKQQRFMGNLMMIVFMILFYNFPSGLNLYWLSSMLLGILQQWWMTKKRHEKLV